MAQVFICRPISAVAEEILKKAGIEIKQNSQNKILSKPELRQAVKGMDGVLALLTDKIDAEVLEAAGSQLKIVANYAVGFDNIDIKAAQKQGVIVTNTPDVLTEAVAEHSLALMMAVARKVVESDKFLRAGQWDKWEPQGFLGPQLTGKTLGVVGLGRIGSMLAKIACRGLGMKVLYYDVAKNSQFERQFKAKFRTLAQLLQQSDVVSLHVPLLPATKHLIGAKELKMMKKSAILINTARGSVVDEEALVKVLEKKEIRGAGLDVFEQEPKVPHQLVKLANVVLTPHIASATHEAREAMAKIAADNLVAVLSGKKPLNPVY